MAARRNVGIHLLRRGAPRFPQAPTRRILAVAALLLVSACAGASDSPREITLLTHDSFAVSEAVLAGFTEKTGVTVRLLTGGDAGTLVNQAILTKDNPTADVLYGIDNTFLGRALENEVFQPYVSPEADVMAEEFKIDERVTAIDFGDVCLNYDKAFFSGTIPPPTSLDDLVDPTYQRMLVVENPATSSPGLAFLMATIDRYGEEGWQDYWKRLLDNEVAVAPDWEAAYFGSFTVGGGGDRPVVVSYASSPPAGVIFSEVPLDDAPTAVMTDGCFRQIEYAGLLKDSEPARQLIDYMLGLEFQEDIPLNMFVFPVNQIAALPPEFVAYAKVPDAPTTLDPASIDANRERWIDEWTQLVAQWP